MKKLMLLTFVLAGLCLNSCSSDDKPKGEADDPNASIVGVWESGDYFVSFSDDGYYAAYLSDKFIDSGSYNYSESYVTCNNPYFNRTTTYDIQKLEEGKMYVDISYKDNNGKTKEVSFVFSRNKSKPATKENTLMGKSATLVWSYFGQVTYSFNTINSGVISATSGSAQKYPLNFFYIYIEDRLYYQTLQPSTGQIPTIGGWSNDFNEVKASRVIFSSNGSISGFTSI